MTQALVFRRSPFAVEAQQIDLPIRPRPARPAADVPLDVVLRPLRSALERQLEEERARNADLQREMEIMQRYIRMASGRT